MIWVGRSNVEERWTDICPPLGGVMLPLRSQQWENGAGSSQVRSGRDIERPPGRIYVPNPREDTHPNGADDHVSQ